MGHRHHATAKAILFLFDAFSIDERTQKGAFLQELGVDFRVVHLRLKNARRGETVDIVYHVQIPPF